MAETGHPDRLLGELGVGRAQPAAPHDGELQRLRDPAIGPFQLVDVLPLDALLIDGRHGDGRHW
jgi:hypothetical protein